MRCPICKKSVTVEGNPFRPFCSERCKSIDLDNWLSERYRIPAPAGAWDQDGAEDDSLPDAEAERD
jgi:endogenous inhibitor of DNA gyrase (YacG/DUF329 family)